MQIARDGTAFEFCCPVVSSSYSSTSSTMQNRDSFIPKCSHQQSPPRSAPLCSVPMSWYATDADPAHTAYMSIPVISHRPSQWSHITSSPRADVTQKVYDDWFAGPSSTNTYAVHGLHPQRSVFGGSPTLTTSPRTIARHRIENASIGVNPGGSSVPFKSAYNSHITYPHLAETHVAQSDHQYDISCYKAPQSYYLQESYTEHKSQQIFDHGSPAVSAYSDMAIPYDDSSYSTPATNQDLCEDWDDIFRHELPMSTSISIDPDLTSPDSTGITAVEGLQDMPEGIPQLTDFSAYPAGAVQHWSGLVRVPAPIADSFEGRQLFVNGKKGYACPFEDCTYGSRKPVSNGSLRTHILTHTLEKPWRCPFPQCVQDHEFGSAQQRNAQTHLERHLGINKKRKNEPVVRLPCVMCHSTKAIAGSGNLRSHVVDVHGKEKTWMDLMENLGSQVTAKNARGWQWAWEDEDEVDRMVEIGIIDPSDKQIWKWLSDLWAKAGTTGRGLYSLNSAKRRRTDGREERSNVWDGR